MWENRRYKGKTNRTFRTKNTTTFFKISLDKLSSDMKMTEERVSGLEDREMELSRLKNKEKNVLKREN